MMNVASEDDMRTAAAMLAACGLKERDIAVALRVDVGQVREWFPLLHSTAQFDVPDDGQ